MENENVHFVLLHSNECPNLCTQAFGTKIPKKKQILKRFSGT